MASLSMPHLKTQLFSKAIQTFDKATAVIVLLVWLAALLFSVLAYSSVKKSLTAREQLATAEASTPLTPKIIQNALPDIQISQIADRLQKRYEGSTQITSGGGKVNIVAKEPSAFTNWLAAVTYVDVIRPDIAWSIDTLCIGSGCSGGIMQVSLNAKTVSFEVPKLEEPEEEKPEEPKSH